MGSTYLDLTNRVLRRLNEVELTASTFAGARGVHSTAKDAVLDTVRKINAQKFEWPFNAIDGSQTLSVTPVGSTYSWPADLRIPDWESFYIENDGTLATSTQRLDQISKEDYWRYWRPRDLDAPSGGLGLPDHVYETEDGGFGVTPTPDKAYIVKFKYFTKTITLSTDSDVCTVPSEYDYVIVDGALHYMYAFLDNDARSSLMEQAFNRGLNYMTYILIPKSPSVTAMMVNLGGQSVFSRNKIWTGG